MNLYDNVHNAFKFTIKNWKVIILLGIILSIGASLTEMKTDNSILLTISIIISTILLFFEESYRYKIIENTIIGDNNPPKLEFNTRFLKEGMIESSILFIYTVIALVISQLIDMISDFSIQTILSILGIIIFFSVIASGINKALHDGKFKSAFNLIEIFAFYKNIGFKNALFLIITGTISYTLIIECVFDFGNLNLTGFIDIIISFFLSPILLVFLTRLMALFGREAVND